MLEIVVCEDHDDYRKLIKENLNSLICEHKINASIVFESGSPRAVEKFIMNHNPNVFFLDIDLNSDLNGLDLASIVHEKYEDAYIVFISQYANLVFQSFKMRPFDFLPKPISKKDLSNVLLEIDQHYSKNFCTEKPGFLNIKIGSKLYQIPKTDIIFIEKSGNKCVIHSSSKIVYCYQSLESFYEKLENMDFIRCHKSFIVNKNYIQSVNLTDMEIILTNNQKCYVGGKFKKHLINELNI